jgi:O-antigen ligase
VRGRPDLNDVPALRSTDGRLAFLIGLALCGAPLFVLTLRGWSAGVLFLGSALCTAFLFFHRDRERRLPDATERFWLRALIAAMAAPAIAVAISSLLQGTFVLARFDSAFRSVLAIAVLLFAIRARFDAARILQHVLPAALAITLIQQHVADQPHKWGADRMATYFADPLVFGYLCLAFGLMCLMAIGPRGDAWWRVALKAAGAALGVYLSVQSGSRTGWLALPVVLALWLHLNWGVKAKRGAELAVVAVAIAASAAVYWFSDTVHARVSEAVQDLATYPWSGVVTTDTSVGLRITYLRIAHDLFLAHPWAGVGETKNSPLAQVAAFPYATAMGVNVAFQSGFHNEIVTNAVRSGVAGLVAAALVLWVPFAIFVRGLSSANAVTRRNAAMGVAFSACIVVSSLTTEVLDLKYTASFYAVMIALLCGATLARHGQE